MKAKAFLFIPVAMLVLTGCSKKVFVTQTGDESFTALTRITDDEEPCMTPFGGDDGKNLYYSAVEEGQYRNLFKKENPVGKSASKRTSGKNFNTTPTYNKALDKIAFSCQNEGSRTSEICMMSNTKGNSLTYITETPSSYETNPSFSSDGTLLVYGKTTYYTGKPSTFSLFKSGSVNLYENSEIWMRDMTNGEDIRICRGYSPSFSPDDEWIVYANYSPQGKSCDIWKIKLDGSENIRITDAKKGYVANPRFSPDGSKIIFELYRTDKKDTDIYMVDADGNNLTQLTKNKSYDGEPYWSNDNYIYFTSDRGNKRGKYQIWRFKAPN